VSGLFAIVILVCLVLIPMLYIQLYPLKLFHKLLDKLHIRKQVFISFGDEFTRSYKNGSENTFDYRYFAGLYLLMRFIILCLHFIPFEYNKVNMITQCAVYVVFGGMIIVFRPHLRFLHSFNEFVIFLSLFIISLVSIFSIGFSFIPYLTSSSLFFLMLINYFVFHIFKMVVFCSIGQPDPFLINGNRNSNPINFHFI
jgi:hypothetical protein